MNACTCPSGDGSLRWPCPVHPALDHRAHPMTGVDMFAVQLVLDGTPMNLTGIDLDAAVTALAARGHSRATIAARCRVPESKVQRVPDAVRARERRSAEHTHRRIPVAGPFAQEATA